jgi:hypothetical protein
LAPGAGDGEPERPVAGFTLEIPPSPPLPTVNKTTFMRHRWPKDVTAPAVRCSVPLGLRRPFGSIRRRRDIRGSIRSRMLRTSRRKDPSAWATIGSSGCFPPEGCYPVSGWVGDESGGFGGDSELFRASVHINRLIRAKR